MRRTTFLALSLVFFAPWAQDSAKGQAPMASQPPSSAKNSRPKRDPALTTPGTDRPVIGVLPLSSSPAADYDGFSVGSEGPDASSLVPPPANSRAAKNNSAGQEALDHEDEALRRKLMICRNCK
ncbi:hypothetical protein ACVIIV_006467 [Bradyrhizobium sp. USDA 4354]